MTKIIEIGIFFDGTGNNGYNADQNRPNNVIDLNPRFASYNTSYTNIFRLYKNHQSTNKENVFSIYIDGIGTVRNKPDSIFFEAVGDSILTSPRPHYSETLLKKIFNIIVISIHNIAKKIFNFFNWLKHTISILLIFYKYSGGYKINKASRKLIKIFENNSIDNLNKVNILKVIEESSKSNESVEIQFNIFGFSRGASLARHYANIIEKLINKRSFLKYIFFTKTHKLDNYFKKANVKINFIGLFDTVESYTKIWHKNKFKQDIFNLADTVCHLTAYNESRENFPLTKTLNRKQLKKFDLFIQKISNNSFYLQNNSNEYLELCLPGAHADIGGGYNQKINNINKEFCFSKKLDSIQRSKIIQIITQEKWSKIVEVDEIKKTFKYGNKNNNLQFIYYYLMESLAKSKNCSFNKTDIKDSFLKTNDSEIEKIYDIIDRLVYESFLINNKEITASYHELFNKIYTSLKQSIHISFDLKPTLPFINHYSKINRAFFPMRPTKDLERKIKN